MASEFGEQIKLAGQAVGDQAGPLGVMADGVESMAGYLDPVSEKITEFMTQTRRLQEVAEEIVRMLAAQSVTLLEHHDTAVATSNELQSAGEMAMRLLVGATSSTALEGRREVNRATTTAQASIVDGDRLLQQMGEANTMAGDQMNPLIEAIYLKMAELSEKIEETRTSSRITVEGWRTSSDAANVASEKLIEYGDSL